MNDFKIFKTCLDGLIQIERSFHEDNRGFFSRIFCSDIADYFDLNNSKTQINYSLTKKTGTIRGMHFQKKPFSENKLVTCISGKIYDVAIDLRPNSNTFLQYYGKILSSVNCVSLLIPEGFAHGFQVLEKNSMLIYMHSAPYKPEYESGVNPMDPEINIKWPLKKKYISNKDENLKLLNKNFDGIKL